MHFIVFKFCTKRQKKWNNQTLVIKNAAKFREGCANALIFRKKKDGSE
jgi:hypothetical protein